MDKGKKSANSKVVKRPNIEYTPYGIIDVDHANATRKTYLQKIRPEEAATKKKEEEEEVFMRKVRRMKTRKDKNGKDWVESREEWLDFGFYNIEMIDLCIEATDNLLAAFKDRKISEEEYHRRKENIHEYYRNKQEEMLDAEDAGIASQVETYEAAREGQI